MRPRNLPFVACSTIGWGKLKDVEGFRRCLASIARAGYGAVGLEFAYLPLSLRNDPAKTRAILDKAGLSLAAVAVDSPSAAKATGSLGCSSCWVCLFQEDLRSAIARTKSISLACRPAGVRLAVHPHVRSSVQTVDELDAILDALGRKSVSICADTAHLAALGQDVPTFLERYHVSVSMVHLKDLRRRSPLRSGGGDEDAAYVRDFVDMGDGVIDFDAVLGTLRDIGFAGPLIVEVDRPRPSPEASARSNLRFLMQRLRDSGLSNG